MSLDDVIELVPDLGRKLKRLVSDIRKLHYQQAKRHGQRRATGGEEENAAKQRKMLLASEMRQLKYDAVVEARAGISLLAMQIYNVHCAPRRLKIGLGLSYPPTATSSCNERYCVLRQVEKSCPFVHAEDLLPGDIVHGHGYGCYRFNGAYMVIKVHADKRVRAVPLNAKNELNGIVNLFLEGHCIYKQPISTAVGGSFILENWSKRISKGTKFACSFSRATGVEYSLSAILALIQIGLAGMKNMLYWASTQPKDMQRKMVRASEWFFPATRATREIVEISKSLNIEVPYLLANYGKLLHMSTTISICSPYFTLPLPYLHARLKHARSMIELEWAFLCCRGSIVEEVLTKAREVGCSGPYIFNVYPVTYSFNTQISSYDKRLMYSYHKNCDMQCIGFEVEKIAQQAQNIIGTLNDKIKRAVAHQALIIDAVLQLPPVIERHIATFLVGNPMEEITIQRR